MAVIVCAFRRLELTVNRTAATHNSADDSQRGNVFLLRRAQLPRSARFLKMNLEY